MHRVYLERIAQLKVHSAKVFTCHLTVCVCVLCSFFLSFFLLIISIFQNRSSIRIQKRCGCGRIIRNSNTELLHNFSSHVCNYLLVQNVCVLWLCAQEMTSVHVMRLNTCPLLKQITYTDICFCPSLRVMFCLLVSLLL